MEAKLFDRLKSSMHQFNIGEMFDIPTGKYLPADGPGNSILNGGLSSLHTLVAPNPPRTNHYAIAKYMDVVRANAPGSPERNVAAAYLFRAFGMSVTHSHPEKAPEVFWMDTEGNGEDTAAFVKDILTKDYSAEERTQTKVEEPHGAIPSVKKFVDIAKTMTQSGRNENFAIMDSLSPIGDK